MNKYRSHNCAALGENDIGKSVTNCWLASS